MASNSYQPEKFWNKKISLSHAIIAFLALLLFLGWQSLHLKSAGKSSEVASKASDAYLRRNVVRFSMSEYKFAHPVLLSDNMSLGDINSNQLGGLKSGINSIIEAKKNAGILTNASVYIKQLNAGGFFSINDEEHYHPASMMKLPIAMTVLRQCEVTPGLLNKELFYTKPQIEGHTQYFPPSEEIKPGTKYTVKELIYRSLVKSDNEANNLLYMSMDKDRFNKLFADLELPFPDMSNSKYNITASEFSRFLRMLYNARYLTSDDADWTLSLLSQSEFKDGMTKELPSSVLVSHKFGEFGENDSDGNSLYKELHETGIIYIPNNPVVITVMTKGKDIHQLAGVISEISKYIYDQMRIPGGS